MSRGLGELWKISNIIYNEMIFRTLLLQSGVGVSDKKAVEKVLKNSSSFVLLKIILVIPIVLMIVQASFYALELIANPTITNVIRFSLSFSSFIIFTFFMIFLVSVLQASVILSGKLFEPLYTLNITKEELSKIAYLAIFKIFDIPVIASIVFSFAALMLVSRNILFAFLASSITAITLLFSYSFLVYVGSKISPRIVNPQTSTTRSLIRMIFMLAYTMIFSLIYIVPSLMGQYLETLLKVLMSLSESSRILIYSLPPISMIIAFTIPLINIQLLNSMLIPTISGFIATIVVVGLIIRSIKNMSKWLIEGEYYGIEAKDKSKLRSKELVLKPSKRYFIGLIKKEFKIIMRNPNTGLTFLFGPALLLVYYLMYIFLTLPYSFLDSMTYFIATFLIMVAPNALIAEGEGINYLISLPIEKKDIVKAKSIVITFSYVIYAVIVVILFSSIGFLRPSYLFFLPLTSGNFLGVYYAIDKTYNEMIKENVSYFNIRGRIDFVLYLLALAIVFFGIPMVSFSIFLSALSTTMLALKIGSFMFSVGLVAGYTIWSLWILTR